MKLHAVAGSGLEAFPEPHQSGIWMLEFATCYNNWRLSIRTSTYHFLIWVGHSHYMSSGFQRKIRNKREREMEALLHLWPQPGHHTTIPLIYLFLFFTHRSNSWPRACQVSTHASELIPGLYLILKWHSNLTYPPSHSLHVSFSKRAGKIINKYTDWFYLELYLPKTFDCTPLTCEFRKGFTI